MNIALIVPGGVDRSGRQRVVPALLWLIERLAQRHNVLVIALHQEPQPARYELLGAQVINLGATVGALPGRRSLQQFDHLRRLRGVLVDVTPKPDLLHAIWIGDTGLMTALAGRMLHIPSILTLGGGELVWLPHIQYGGMGRPQQRWPILLALRLATRVTVSSRYVENQLPAWRKPAIWLPLGVDANLFSAPVTRPPGPPWRLLHTASINRVKDPFTLVAALKQVAARVAGVHLDWVGEDTLGGQVQRLVRAEGLQEVIRFHGFQTTDVVSQLCRQAHLYIQSSLHEGQGVAPLEAAAAGVPTVGAAVGLVAELAPEAAVATAPGDPMALAQGIEALLLDAHRRETVGRAAQIWAQRYDADWTAQQMELLYLRTRDS